VAQPAGRVSWQRPPRIDVLGLHQPPITYPAAVSGIVRAKLRADTGVDSVTADDEIGRGPCAVFEDEIDRVSSVVLGITNVSSCLWNCPPPVANFLYL